MLKRILTSAVGLVFFFLIIFAGEVVFKTAISVVTLFMLYEMYKTIKCGKVLSVVGFLCAAMLLASIIFGRVTLEFATAVCICVYLAVMVFMHPKLTFKDISTGAFMTFFVTIFFGTMIRIYTSFGVLFVLLVFVCAWTSDTGAYFTGRAIGRHKLIPKVSPKKTVEGAIGGVLTAAISCVIYMIVIGKLKVGDINVPGYLSAFLIGMIASCFAQIGDLVASAIKRDCDAKDFGNILPGHGGVLDRFDSVIYITPVIYYFLAFVLK